MEKHTPSQISVIVPIFHFPENFQDVRKSILQSTTPLEIFYIVDVQQPIIIEHTENFEHIIKIENKGRGFMLAEGVRRATGDIILFLHADTQLPKNWDRNVRDALSDEQTIGGGFTFRFDHPHVYLRFFSTVVISVSNLTKIFSGDRAIFIRADLMKNNMGLLETPIMEDLALTYFMRKRGSVKIINNKVITSADAFFRHGFLRQTMKIIIGIIRYKSRGDPQKIYEYYYSK